MSLAEWTDEAIPGRLTVFDFPAAHLSGCAPPMAWRESTDARRRTRVANIFPNSDSCLRLVCAWLAELDDA